MPQSVEAAAAAPTDTPQTTTQTMIQTRNASNGSNTSVLAGGSDGVGPEGQLGLCDVYDLQGQPDPDGEIAYFLSVPWCRAHLRPAEGRPPGAAVPSAVLRIVQPDSRRQPRPAPGPDGHVRSRIDTPDNVFSTTLNTPDTVRAFMVFFEEPAPLPGASPAYLAPVIEIKALMYLGPGLNGHLGVAHGGIVATLLDEILGLLIPLNRRRAKHNRRAGAVPPPYLTDGSVRLAAPEAAAAASAAVDKGFVTGYLNTTYLRPVRTSAPVLLTARYLRMEGTRKFFLEGAVWDDQSHLLAKADSVFIALKEKL